MSSYINILAHKYIDIGRYKLPQKYVCIFCKTHSLAFPSSCCMFRQMHSVILNYTSLRAHFLLALNFFINKFCTAM